MVASDVEFGVYQARAVWDIVPDPLMDLGIGIGVGLIDYDLQLDSLTGTNQIQGDDRLPFGFVTVRAAKSLGDLEVLVHASGLGFELDDQSIQFIDLQGLLIWRFWDLGTGHAELQAGYRYFDVEYELDGAGTDLDADGTLSGPVVGLSVRF